MPEFSAVAGRFAAFRRSVMVLVTTLFFLVAGFDLIPTLSTVAALVARPATATMTNNAAPPLAPAEPLPALPLPTAGDQLIRELPYGAVIDEVATRHGLDRWLFASLVQAESRFRRGVVSSRGAVGLTQILPATARAMGAEGDLMDPEANLDAGGRYLSVLLADFDGDVSLALAAYNAGPAAVKRYGGIPPFPETRDFVERVLAGYVTHHRRVQEAEMVAALPLVPPTGV